MNVLKIGLLSSAMLLAFGYVAAQETADVAEIIALDEEVTAADLGVSEPNLLPDSPFYFLKNWGRAIQSAFTFGSVKKAELKERFANEKLVEVKKMVEQNKNREEIEKAVQNYQQEIGQMARATEKIRERAEESVEVGKFLDKFTQQQVLHQRVLQKLEEQVPTEVFEKIQEAREEHLEKFGEVMTRLENKENLRERLEKNLEEVKGSEFKELKNLEILKGLEEKVPEVTKGVIQQVRTNALIRLKRKIEEMPAEKIEQFQTYIEKISGLREERVEILENLKEELKALPEIKEIILQSRERIMEQIREKIIETNCPEIEKPGADFCANGRVIIQKDEKGCVVSFDCVMPAETKTQACITLWAPVCGKNGKTYSNKCFAEVANVEVDYEGVCKNLETSTQLKEQIRRLMSESIAPSAKPTQ